MPARPPTKFRLYRRNSQWEMWLSSKTWARMTTGTLRECISWCFFEKPTHDPEHA